MRYFTLLSLLLPLSMLAQREPNVPREIQAKFITAKDGDVIKLPAGTYQFDNTLSMDGKKNITIIGAGRKETILSFKNQTQGAEGLRISNCSNITLKDFTAQDAKGDLIKVQNTDGITFENIVAEWTGKPKKSNGAYALYPVQCERVLIDNCEAIGASDAGIYVGQSNNIIVRNSRAYRNVAGIEIENSTNAEVYDNLAEGNTGGILVFDLPGLIKKKGGNVKVYRNNVKANNYKNFAPKGNTVGKVPPGTGIMVLATSDVEVFENEVIDNRTVSVCIVSYFITETPITDATYDPYPGGVYVHDNNFAKGKNNKMMPTFKNKIGILLWSKFKRKVPHVVYDGIVKPEHLDRSGQVKEEHRICVRNNKNQSFANLDAANKFKKISKDITPFDCTRERLK